MSKTCGECQFFNPAIITRNGYGMCTTGWLAGQHVDSCTKACAWSISGFKRRITNGDKIRQMSNEEFVDNIKYLCFKFESKKELIAWLNSPAESEGEGISDIYLTREEIEHPYADIKTMIEDKRRKAEQMRKTVFAKITASPEVLAEEMVFCIHDDLETWWTSNILNKYYNTREEAIAATLARLKEVIK